MVKREVKQTTPQYVPSLLLWVSGALPGSVHDKKAEWIWGVLDELEAAGLIVLADKGYQGAAHAKLPYRGKNKPESGGTPASSAAVMNAWRSV